MDEGVSDRMPEWISNIDAYILLFLQETVRSPFLTPVVEAVTMLGDGAIFWIAVSLILLAIPKTRKAGSAGLLALVLSLLVNNIILKNLVGRIRPFDMIEGLMPLIKRPGDFSFPSGHTGSSFAAAWVLYRRLRGWKGVLALVLAGLIGLSRLYLGVHYPTDVLFGVVSGIGCGYAADLIIKKICKEKAIM